MISAGLDYFIRLCYLLIALFVIEGLNMWINKRVKETGRHCDFSILLSNGAHLGFVLIQIRDGVIATTLWF